MRILFAVDIHGNKASFARILDQAKRLRIDAVILGGDILPAPRALKSFSADQGEFIEEVVRPWCEEIRHTTKAKAFIMLGNDDSSVCAHGLLDMEYEGLLYYIHMRPQPLGEYTVYGYSFVPLTPFGIKDWDKFDTADQVPPPTGYPPFFTREDGTMGVEYDRDVRPRGSIEDDLKAIAAEEDSSKTVYVTHSPPYGTALDIIYSGEHVGSKALRRFIEETQPPLTFHGHIHESPTRSGRIFDRIGDTICINPGASLETLNAVFVDTEDIERSIELMS